MIRNKTIPIPHMLLSIMLVSLLILSSQGVTALPPTQEYWENREKRSYDYEDSIPPSDGENGRRDIPSPGIPSSGPPDLENMTNRIGRFFGTTGSFVSFETAEEGISNYSLRLGRDDTLRIFDHVTVEDSRIYQEQIADHTYILQGDALEMKIYDAPSALIKLNVNPLESERKIAFRTGDIEISDDKRGTIDMVFEDHRAEGYLGSLKLIRGEKGKQITPEINEDFINYTIKDQTIFAFQIGRDDDFSNHIKNEISNGNIGAEVRVESMKNELNMMSTSYRDITLMSQMRHESKLEIITSSETLGEEGTVLFLDISSNVMNVSSPEDIQLSIDEEAASVIENYDDVRDLDESSYWADTGEQSLRLLVNIPHFSTRSIAIEYLEDISDEYWGSFAYYMTSAAISAGLVTLGLLYRKSKKRE